MSGGPSGACIPLGGRGAASARQRTPRSSTHAERGAGTILALGLGLLLVVACMAVALLGQALGASSRAASAADLAALAAADTERGLRPGDACSAASETAGLNDAAVVACEIEVPGSIVRVVVTVEGGPLWGPVPGRARAGPPQ